MSHPLNPITGLCPACGAVAKRVYSSKKRAYYWHCKGCNRWFWDADGEPKPPAPRTVTDIPCPACAKSMDRLTGSMGDFLKCPACGERMEIDAPLCPLNSQHGPMLRKLGRNGLFWSCRKFPECQETLDYTGENPVDDPGNA